MAQILLPERFPHLNSGAHHGLVSLTLQDLPSQQIKELKIIHLTIVITLLYVEYVGTAPSSASLHSIFCAHVRNPFPAKMRVELGNPFPATHTR